MEAQEALKTGAVVSELSNSVESEIDNLLANSVVASGEVVSRVLLSRDELLRMEKLSIGTGSNLVEHSRLKVEEYGARNMLASASLREERIEGVVATSNALVGRHLTVGLDSVLKAEELPASVADLDASLTAMNRNDFSHCVVVL